MNRPNRGRRSPRVASEVCSDDKDERAAATEQYIPLRIDETERILAQVMSSLPTAEREKIMEEVHGVSKPMEETPEFVADKLAEMVSEIEIYKTEAYELALKQNQNFVEDSDFRLMFLRCEKFVPSAASIRMMRFLSLKQKYFGKEKITKDIDTLDLSEEDIESLESGAIQILSEKDRSGRAVIVVFPWLCQHVRTPETMMRASFLMEMSLVRDPEVQKRGVVYIYHDTTPRREDSGAPDGSMVLVARNHKASMPLHYAAHHVCLRDRSGYHSIGHAICKEEDIVKVISHYGDNRECLRTIQGFGIPISCFPIDSDEGTVNFAAHREWIEHQREMAFVETPAQSRASARKRKAPSTAETSLASESGYHSDSEDSSDAGGVTAADRAAQMAPQSMIKPTEKDVVFGRGRFFQYYPGNETFRQFVENKETQYNKANRTEKVHLTKAIVSELKANGIRFLKLDQNESGKNIWTHANEKEIYKKVSQVYRTVRKKERN